jgi:hypothetical protein
MIHLYLFLNSFAELRSKCTIDLSKISIEFLADECDKLVQHHKSCVLFLGYLDPGWMLDPKHEARVRHAIRKFETHMISFHIESIPFAWKNEIDTVYYQSPKNGGTKTINNGSAVHSESKDEN